MQINREGKVKRISVRKERGDNENRKMWKWGHREKENKWKEKRGEKKNWRTMELTSTGKIQQ